MPVSKDEPGSLNFGEPVKFRSVGNIHPAFRTTLTQGMADYQRKYPWVNVDELIAVNKYMDFEREGYGIAFQRGKRRGIAINIPAHLNKEYTDDVNTVGYTWGTKGVRNTLRHEFGHHFTATTLGLMDPSLGPDLLASELDPEIVKHLYPFVAEAFRLAPLNYGNAKRDFRGYIASEIGSGYADRDPGELMAEIFTRSEIKGPGHIESKRAIENIAAAASKKHKMLNSVNNTAKQLLDLRKV